MINVVTILFEGITTWLCLHIVFGKKIEKRWSSIIYIPVSVVFFSLCSFNIISKKLYFLFIVFYIVYAKYNFGGKFVKTLMKSFLSIVLLTILEGIVLICCNPIFVFVDNIEIECIVAITIIYVLAHIIYNFSIDKDNTEIVSKHMFIYVAIIFAFFICLKIEFETSRKIELIYVIFFFILAVYFVLVCSKQKKIFELEKQNIKFELQNMYGTAYESLLKEVRRRQHDYKNQLEAISSISVSIDNINDLKIVQGKYIEILEKDSKFDTILTKCDNAILAGYLYSKCIDFERNGVDIDIKLSVYGLPVDFKSKDIIEVCGILFSNAYEGVIDLCDDNKQIKVCVNKTDDRIEIKVRNINENLSYEQIDEMFSFGYSSKGSDRGIGLFSLKKIVKKYNGEIFVRKIEENNLEWIEFNVCI